MRIHKQKARQPGQGACVESGTGSRRNNLGIPFGALASFFCCALTASLLIAAPSPQQTDPPEWVKPPDFMYSPAGKPDPFQPAIQTTAPESSPEEKPKKALTPLERIQPSQLKLVGIIIQGRKRQALVELPNGKAYVLKVGLSVGQRQGKVTAITSRKVVIQETTSDIFGKKTQNETILQLFPQGEKSNG